MTLWTLLCPNELGTSAHILAIELSSGWCCFLFWCVCLFISILVLWPILNLKQFNCYLHIPSFKMPAIRHVQQLIQHGDYAFSIDLQDAHLHIPIVKHHHCFYDQFDTTHLISGRFYLLGWPQPLGFSQPSLNLFCSFAITRVSVLLSIWMTSWYWFALSGQARERAHFLCSILVFLGLHVNFSKSDLWLTQTFCFLGLCWDTVLCHYRYLLKN